VEALVPDLSFSIEGAEVVPFAVTPQLAFKLRVRNADPDEAIHTVALHCQIQIEATRRRYHPEEQGRLKDLFGEPERWGQTLRTLLWTHTSVVVPPFVGSTEVDLPVPCTFDFNVATTKYFAGLSKGEIPLCMQFSGTVFYAKDAGPLQVMPIPWDKEARFKLPVQTWKELIETYYPNTAWLCLRRDVFECLHRYKIEHGVPTWEETVERVLSCTEEEVRS
jgi:Family of unknown function (DUF6084)